MDRGAAQDLFLGLFGMLEIEIDPLLDVGELQYLVDGVVAAVLDQIHHQRVVADAEFTEATQPRPCVHQIVEQHPTFRVENVIARVLGGVGLVDRLHHVVGDIRKRLLATAVVIDHARGGGGVGVDDVVALSTGVAQRF